MSLKEALPTEFTYHVERFVLTKDFDPIKDIRTHNSLKIADLEDDCGVWRGWVVDEQPTIHSDKQLVKMGSSEPIYGINIRQSAYFDIGTIASPDRTVVTVASDQETTLYKASDALHDLFTTTRVDGRLFLANNPDLQVMSSKHRESLHGDEMSYQYGGEIPMVKNLGNGDIELLEAKIPLTLNAVPLQLDTATFNLWEGRLRLSLKSMKGREELAAYPFSRLRAVFDIADRIYNGDPVTSQSVVS